MKYDKSFGLSLSLEPCLMTSQNGGASIYAEELEAAFAISAFVPNRWSMERAKESAFGILWPTAG